MCITPIESVMMATEYYSNRRGKHGRNITLNEGKLRISLS